MFRFCVTSILPWWLIFASIFISPAISEGSATCDQLADIEELEETDSNPCKPGPSEDGIAPFLVYIWNSERYHKDSALKWAQGTIVSYSFVLTLGVFVSEPEGWLSEVSDLMIYYGQPVRTPNVTSEFQKQVAKIIRHPKFYPKTFSLSGKQNIDNYAWSDDFEMHFKNDLAMIKTTTPFEFGPRARPICIMYSPICLTENSFVYGYKGDLLEKNPVFRKVKMAYVTDKVDGSRDYERYKTKSDFAGRSENHDDVFCNGAEGSPLMVFGGGRPLMLGILESAKPFCHAGQGDVAGFVDTRQASARDFIVEVIARDNNGTLDERDWEEIPEDENNIIDHDYEKMND